MGVNGTVKRSKSNAMFSLFSMFFPGSVGSPMPIGKLIHYFRLFDSGEVNVSRRTLEGAHRSTYLRIPRRSGSDHRQHVQLYGWRQVESARTEDSTSRCIRAANAMYGSLKDGKHRAGRRQTRSLSMAASFTGPTNHPKRSTRSTTNDLSATTGPEWVEDVEANHRVASRQNFRVQLRSMSTGPTGITPDRPTIRRIRTRRLRSACGSEGVANVVPSTSVAADTIIAVVKNRRVVSVLNSMPMVTQAQFRANPEDDYNFVTMAATAVEIKVRRRGSGAALLTQINPRAGTQAPARFRKKASHET